MLKKIGRIAVVGMILGMLISIIITSSVFATIPQPDSTPTLINLHVNRNLISANDTFVYGMYNLPYSANQTIAADQTFTFSLMNTAKTITYGTSLPFVYDDNGYNRGVIAWYFSPNVLRSGIAANIQIGEVDTQFTAPVDVDVTLPITAFTSQTTQAANQAEAAANLFAIGQILQGDFGTELFVSSGGRDVLTDAGESYLRGAIPGLQSIAPVLYLLQQLPLDISTKQYTTAKFDSYQARFQGTWVGDSMDAGGDLLGMGGNTFMMFIFTLPLCLGAVIFTSMKFHKTEPGLILASLFMIMAVIMGWMPTALFAVVFQLFAIYIGYLLFFSKSNGEFDTKLLSFLIFSYFASVLICVILEGTYFGSSEGGVLNSWSFTTPITLPVVGPIPVFDTGFIQSIGKILTWDYSFYTGSYAILRWFWFAILSAGPVWALVKIFINLIPSIISIFRPSITGI